jgi:hypothetical protein
MRKKDHQAIRDNERKRFDPLVRAAHETAVYQCGGAIGTVLIPRSNTIKYDYRGQQLPISDTDIMFMRSERYDTEKRSVAVEQRVDFRNMGEEIKHDGKNWAQNLFGALLEGHVQEILA